MKKIGFIGAGNMASSLIKGLLNADYDVSCIRASDPKPSEQLLDLGIELVNDNPEITRWADVIVLAVKPQSMQAVCRQISAQVKTQPLLVISIAAGIRSDAIIKWLQVPVPCIRVMPNTPAMYGAGMSGLFANNHAGQDDINTASAIMQTAGKVIHFPNEDMIDAVTAISGSGPAYFFLLIEHMISAGTELGLSETDARLLATQTALGAATMALQPEADVADLRRRVTSPGGTTERALQTFIDGGFPQLVTAAVHAAAERSRELSAQLEANKND